MNKREKEMEIEGESLLGQKQNCLISVKG